jgi:uncharacterized damage-inducible protein DinB
MSRTVAATQILKEQFADSNARVLKVLDGIGDEEFFWEPCAGCWTLHRRSEIRASRVAGAGDWVLDDEWISPPTPVTTIAWRTIHIAAVNYVYWDHAFGPATATFDLEFPGDAEAAIAWLAASQQPLAHTLQSLSDDEMGRPRLTNWGEEWYTYRLFKTLVNEQVHHGAEISLLRDLYRNRDTLGKAD